MTIRFLRAVLLILTASAAGEEVWGDASLSLGGSGSYEAGAIPLGESVTPTPGSAATTSLFGDLAYSDFLARSDKANVSIAVEGLAALDPLARSQGLFGGALLSGGIIGEGLILNGGLFGNVGWWNAAQAPAWASEALSDSYGPQGLAPAPLSLLHPTGSAGGQLSASIGDASAALTLKPRVAALFGDTPGWTEDLALRGDLSLTPQLIVSLSGMERFESRADGSTTWQVGGGPGITWYSRHGALFDAQLLAILQESTLLSPLAAVGVQGSASSLILPVDSFFELQALLNAEAAMSQSLRARVSLQPALLFRGYPHVEMGVSAGSPEWELDLPLSLEMIMNVAPSLSLHTVPSWTGRFSNSDYLRLQSVALSFYAEWRP